MGIPNLPLLLLITTLFFFSLTSSSSSDLIYKGCANQTFSTPTPTIQPSLAALASTLTTQSTTSKFFKTTTQSTTQPLFGLFQCRGDLSPQDCSSCLAQALPMWTALCPNAVAARIQLNGCLALYQISNFPQVSGTQLLFKTCSSNGGGGDFEVRRDTAFANLQSGVVASGVGFFATSYQSVYVLAQCEGDLSTADCGECVAQAVQKSEVECGGASSGQVYLDKCYISYSYYPNGVPHGGGGGGLGGGQQTGKTVAIVVGGAAALGFLVICLLFARSLLKKKDDY